jgi:hypothetical protein
MTIIGLVFPYRFTARIRGGANKKLFFVFLFSYGREDQEKQKMKRKRNNR